MTPNVKSIAAGAAVAALIGTTGVTTWAREQGPGGPRSGVMGRRGPGGPGMGGPMGILAELRGLDLTDAQRGQVRATLESHRGEVEPGRTRLMEARRALRDAVTAAAFDEGAVRARSADVAAAEADAAVLQAKVHSEVWALLTPEQQQKAAELKARRQQRAGQMRERLQQRRDQRRQPRY